MPRYQNTLRQFRVAHIFDIAHKLLYFRLELGNSLLWTIARSEMCKPKFVARVCDLDLTNRLYSLLQ